jgi:hypothetical protein
MADEFKELKDQIKKLSKTNTDLTNTIIKYKSEIDAALRNFISKGEKSIAHSIAGIKKWTSTFDSKHVHVSVGSCGLNARSGGYDRTIRIDGKYIMTTGRSYGLVVFDTKRKRLIHRRSYDVYRSYSYASRLASDIHRFVNRSGYLIIVNTYNEPRNRRTYSRLRVAMRYLGATLFENRYFRYRSAYMLVFLAGHGKIHEAYAGMYNYSRGAKLYYNNYIKLK